MTDELDPQTQQHIDDSADTIDDCDTSTSSDGGIDAAVEELLPPQTRPQTQMSPQSKTK